ncbi:MAG: hypothetical protein AAF591_05960 [Verrucomicrobiota bacterium]
MKPPMIGGIAAAALFVGFSLHAFAEVNESAKKLAVLLAPQKASEKVGEGDLKAVEGRLIKIMEMLEESQATSGPSGRDLIVNACQVELRDEMSRKRMLVTAGTIVRSWEAARALGLFNESRRFSHEITRGPDQGKRCVFEYIVPTEKYPGFSKELMNVRLVAPSDARKKGEEHSERDMTVGAELAALEKEVLYGRPDEMGRTAADNLRLWEAEVEAAGEAFSDVPSVKLSGGLSSSPSSLNDYRWRVSLEAHNFSRHPTEVTVETYVFCTVGDGSDDLLVFCKDVQEVKLRRSEVWEHDVWTRSIGKNPNDRQVAKREEKKSKKGKAEPLPEMRGWAANVLHNGKSVAWDASLRSFERHLAEVESIPKYVPPSDDKKKKKK